MVALALRLAVGLLALGRGGVDAVLTPDSFDYMGLGTAIAQHGTFGSGEPEVFRPPGYPLALSLALWPQQEGVRAVLLMTGWLFQITLGALTCLLLWSLAQRLGFSERAASMAAWLCAVEPLSVMYSTLMLSETLFTFLLVATFIALLRAPTSLRFSVMAGMGLTGLVYTRAAACYLPMPAFFLAAAWAWRVKQPLARVLPVLLVPLMAMGLWIWRNQVQADYAGFAAVKEYNLGVYWGAAVRSRVEGRTFHEVSEEIKNSLYERRVREGWTQGAMYRQCQAEGLEVLMSDPVEAAFLHLKGMAVAVLDPGSSEALQLAGLRRIGGGLLARIQDQGITATFKGLVRHETLFTVVTLMMGLMLVFLYVFAAIGWKSLGWSSRILVGGVILYLVMVSGGANATGRFRHPAMPFFCLLAGAGLASRRDFSANSASLPL